MPGDLDLHRVDSLHNLVTNNKLFKNKIEPHKESKNGKYWEHSIAKLSYRRKSSNDYRWTQGLDFEAYQEKEATFGWRNN